MRNSSTKITLIIIFSVTFYLTARAQKAELVIQTGHTGLVLSAVFSPNGKLFATGGMDGTVKLWDAIENRELKTFREVDGGVQPNVLVGGVNQVMFSPDGKTLVSGHVNSKIILWDVISGEKIKIFSSPGNNVLSVTFSPDGKLLASGGTDRKVKVWDIDTGMERKTFDGHTGMVTSLVFSPDGKTLASAGAWDKTIIFRDLTTGSELTITTGIPAESIAFSPDGKTLVSSGSTESAGIIQLWDVSSKREIKKLLGHLDFIASVCFSPDGKFLASAGGYNDKTVKLWDISKGTVIKSLPHSSTIFSVDFSPDGKTLISGSDRLKLFDVAEGREIKDFPERTNYVERSKFSPNGKMLAVVGGNINTKLWNFAGGPELSLFTGHTGNVRSVAFSPDGKTLATGSEDNLVKLWDVRSGLELKSFPAGGAALEVAFSSDGKTLVAEIGLNAVKVWDIASGKEIRSYPNKQFITILPDNETLVLEGQIYVTTESSWGYHGDSTIYLVKPATNTGIKMFTGHTGSIWTVALSPDGKTLASGGRDKTIKLWNIATAEEIRTLTVKDGGIARIAFSTDSKTMASMDGNQNVTLWNVASGVELKTYPHISYVNFPEIRAVVPKLFYEENVWQTYFPFSPDGRFKFQPGENGKLNLFEADTEKLLATLISMDEGKWVITTPEGLFDASPGARKLMHYVIGIEPIALEQMKDLYYVPGLLQKIFKGDPLPKVELFSNRDLFPAVEFGPLLPGQKQFTVKLVNRGGGIGQLQVLFNGKELIADARPAGFDPNSPDAAFIIDLSNAAVKTGEENNIEIVARNTSGSLSTKGTRGAEIVYVESGKKQIETPNIYAIVGGISEYTGGGMLKLNFASKDAEDFARALELGATALLNGDKSKVHLRLLTSNGFQSGVKLTSPDAKVSGATKADFQNAFNDFKNATSNDVFIVYLAGHGISLNLNRDSNAAGGDVYLYLTQEATTTDKSVLSIESLRKAMAISSEELKDMMKQNKALKQVLILDTCAAGALSGNLVLRRELPADQIRAIERLKDSTGFFVLMGASADAVSYEASQYGQGLLTYSLLQAMKGAKLRENQFADIDLLFGYAQDTVPIMAKNIGGIQRPLIITPENSISFDIGKFTPTEQKQIILLHPKPIVLNPNLQNRGLDYDNLELTSLLRRELRNLTSEYGPSGVPLVFVEAEEMVDAFKPSGSYLIRGNEIIVTIRLIQNKIPVGDPLTITGKVSEKETLIKHIVRELLSTMKEGETFLQKPVN